MEDMLGQPALDCSVARQWLPKASCGSCLGRRGPGCVCVSGAESSLWAITSLRF